MPHLRQAACALAALCVATAALPAQAQESYSATDPATGSTVGTPPRAKKVSPSVYDSPTYLNLATGWLNFDDASTRGTSRLMTALVLDWNIQATRPVETPVQYGVETGVVFSHLGAAGSNFFGSSGPTTVGSGANLFLFPVDLWGGYSFGQRMGLASIHTGANMLFRSTSAAMSLGRGDNDTGSSVDFFPNVGASVGWTVGQNVALSLRLDWTLAPTNTPLVGAIGATIPLS